MENILEYSKSDKRRTAYLEGLNTVIQLFDGQEIMDGIERYYSTGMIPSRSWFIAINVIIAHAYRERSCFESSEQSEKYMGNAMSMIPSTLMSEPNPLNAGALLSMVSIDSPKKS
jgi:hypothetical protein